jgi:glucan-binding YG repeat protein
MPEEIEIDTDKLRETIDEEVEKESGSLLRTIALTTALFAAFAAVASLQAGSTVNEALALKTESTQLQAQASDQWAYYQAKGIKSVVLEAQKNTLLALDKAPSADAEKTIQRYKDEQNEARKSAEELEHKRDERDKEANELIHHHHYYAFSVALLQVAIALGAVAALTRKRLAWMASAALGVAGAGVFAYALLAH